MSRVIFEFEEVSIRNALVEICVIDFKKVVLDHFIVLMINMSITYQTLSEKYIKWVTLIAI